MTNLQDSLYKEFLITNRFGAYCNTTLVGCNILYYAENGTIASIRVIKIEDESESATYVTSGLQYEVFPLPASWREGDYVIVVTIGDRHYRETFPL